MSAIALGVYIVPFTLAYGRISASVGALVLFGAVQVTMIGAGLIRGERPARVDWLGVLLALGGLLVLTIPGATAPDPTGMALMATAGVVLGRLLARRARGRRPARRDRGQLRPRDASPASSSPRSPAPRGTSPRTASCSRRRPARSRRASPTRSGMRRCRRSPRGARPSCSSIVPVLTAIAAALLLGEAITSRLVLATALVLLGVLLTIVPRWHRASPAAPEPHSCVIF